MSDRSFSRCRIIFLYTIILCGAIHAQAPSSIQVFMPDGSLPPRELRFSLSSEDGRVEIYYTDSKGKFLFTRSQGLAPDKGYTITIESDGQTYGTTTVSFKHYTASSVFYVPIFLKPFKPKAPQPAGVVDVAELDVLAPKQAREAYDEAMRALRSGDTTRSIDKLKAALKLYPDYFRALNDLGVIFMKLDQLDEASRAFERAAQLAPRVYHPRLNLGIIKTRQGKYKEAIEILNKLHGENPGLIQVLVPLADALMAANRIDEAEPLLKTAIASTPEGDSAGDAHYRLGLLFNRKQRFEEAVQQLEAAAKALPDSARIHLQLGGALLQLKRFQDSERELMAAYKLAGAQMGGAQFLLGQLYFTQQKYQDAMRAFEQYLIDVPDAPNGAEVKTVIDKIRAALAQR